MNDSNRKYRHRLIAVVAMVAGCIACVLADSPALSADTASAGFTPAEQRALVAFLLQNNLGKAVEANVVALLGAHDRDCAIRLVMDVYHVPQDVAELFVRLHTQPEATPAAPGK